MDKEITLFTESQIYFLAKLDYINSILLKDLLLCEINPQSVLTFEDNISFISIGEHGSPVTLELAALNCSQSLGR